MNVLAINGSPRKGNTDFILGTILAKEDEIIRLREKKIEFCSGCDYGCPKTKRCSIDDDMPEIYRKLEKADLVILASPCFFSNVSAMMKNFMDRCNPYYFNKKLKDKRFFLIAVGGYEPSLKDELACMRNFLKEIYAKEIGFYGVVADKASDLEKNKKVIKELGNLKDKLQNA